MNDNLNNFWNNKKVLITGHTGFKGSWLTIFLNYLGSEVHGLSREEKPGIYSIANVKELLSSETKADISTYDIDDLNTAISKISPDIVFHLAAQSLVIKSYEDPKDTVYSNVIGTYNVLDSINKSQNTKSLIIATTDKVYKYPEKENKEDAEIGGSDFYSATKSSAELLINAFINSSKNNSLNVSVVRSGNVIGGGDRSENRLMTDLVMALNNDQNFNLRMPESIRPWQYILDSLHGYLLIGQENFEEEKSEIYNLNSKINNDYNSRKIAELMFTNWGTSKEIIFQTDKMYKEVDKLTIDSSKATKNLNWMPKYSVEETVEEIVQWEKYYKKNSGCDYSLNQIKKFIEK